MWDHPECARVRGEALACRIGVVLTALQQGMHLYGKACTSAAVPTM